MRALVRDTETLRALRPPDVAAYLRTRGWALAEREDMFARYTYKRNGTTFDVELPHTSAYRDFAVRMSEVLAALERVEARSQAEIIEDLSVSSADIVRLRLLGNDVVDGSLSLEDGALFVDAAREVMLASACAALKPRLFYGSRKPAEAVEFVSKLRLGQTERGSFVLKVLSPVAPLLEAEHLFPELEPPPLERRATETLLVAGGAAATAAVEAGVTNSLTAFEKSVGVGVSADLCGGLARMLVGRSHTALELSVAWARNRPPPARALPAVRISSDTAGTLAAASRELKARAPREDFELEGYVVNLDSEKVAEGGTVIIAGDVDGGTRRVRVPLTGADYNAAIDAHKRAARVSVAGRLTRSGRQYELAVPRDFAVLGDE